MIPHVPPIAVSRPLLFGLVAVGAIAAVASPPPTSSFAAGFAAGAGAVFVISFMKNPRDAGGRAPNGDGENP
jgi:hypothetical protein